MSLGRAFPGYVEVVEQKELLAQAVSVGCNIGSVGAESGISLSLGHIAKNLIVGSVFLYYIKHMFEYRRFSYPVRHRFRTDAVSGFFPCQDGPRQVVERYYRVGIRLQCTGVGEGD